MADKITVNCSTGEASTADWTAEDEAARPTPGPEPVDRMAVLEAKIAAAEELASKANVTAQEVAAAMKNAKPA